MARGQRVGDGCPEPSLAIVVPSLVRGSLANLLTSLSAAGLPPQAPVVVVDDRAPDQRDDEYRSLVEVPASLSIRWLTSGGAGPAAARNTGWRSVLAEWIVFLDDDVEVQADWVDRLVADLRAAEAETDRSATPTVGVQGRIEVPLPPDRRPTDWERSTAGLADATWATADMAYRRSALVQVGGFDERFRRAYREDADIGLRMTRVGRISWGTRTVDHPVRPAPWTVSIKRQAGNADDVLMWRKHGTSWRRRAAAPAGRRPQHAVVTAAGLLAVAAAATGHRRVARSSAAGWLAGTVELTWRRVQPGPRSPGEVAAMIATSVAIPPTATGWWLVGLASALSSRLRPADDRSVAAVFFDRDGTLIHDVPYNGDPELVEPKAGALGALARLRHRGLPIALVSNQSGVGTGRITAQQMHDVNRRTSELLGPFDAVVVCPHAPDDGCACRKPAPGMLLDAASQLQVDPSRCVMVGDIGSDVSAAQSAGARAVLVPNETTRHEEISAAAVVAGDLTEAVDMILAGCT